MTLTIESQLAWRIAYVPALATLLVTVLATLAIGTLAALYPSWQATRRRLIELVQYE
jgi:ABC-type antimicrobial peptide transport system permease subunit